jgi:hypothetical protein
MLHWGLQGEIAVWPTSDSPLAPHTTIPSEVLEHTMLTQFADCRFVGFHYKVHESSNKLSALQLIYTNNYTSPMFMAHYENYYNMKRVILP